MKRTRQGGEVVVKGSPEEVASAAAEIFTETAVQSVSRRGCFRVALSGGSTPRAMHRKLAETPCVERVPWDATYLFWADERCVPPLNEASNYGAAERDFLARSPLRSDHCFPMPGEMPPPEGALVYEQQLRKTFDSSRGDFPVFDAIFLGMGGDGHTASLFPGDVALAERQRLVLAVRGGNPNVDRLTLTLPVINHARGVIVIVTGAEKALAVQRAFAPRPWRLPIQLVRPLTGRLLWLLDRAAALLL